MSETAAPKAHKPTKNEKRRAKQKAAVAQAITKPQTQQTKQNQRFEAAAGDDDLDVRIEYVSAVDAAGLGLGEGVDAALMEQFKSVFSKFVKPEELTTLAATTDEAAPSSSSSSSSSSSAPALASGGEDEDDNGNGAAGEVLSKKKKKLLSRLSVSELKQLVQRPDVVEAHDVTSSDPRLLVYLKSYRNTVPVPRHWCYKRKFLSGKRGVEKPAFHLPDFIADTGIAKIRDSLIEQEATKKNKQLARNKTKPTMGKIDIDYQVLHDAFFKFQTKPKLTSHGDLYYEGKEFEVNMKERKPGVLSNELKAMLGMQVVTSSTSEKAPPLPPPWLINMQRFGPPPSYPNMRIPGLSAPIPQGASFGYQPGGWGKPPVDEYGRPLYGDVFGALVGLDEGEDIIDKQSKWGEIVPLEEEEEEEDDDDEEQEGEGEESGQEGATAGWGGAGGKHRGVGGMSGIETPSSILDGTTSVQSIAALAAETMDLRKRAAAGAPGTETPDGMSEQRELYRVIQEKQAKAGAGGELFFSDRTYALGGGGDDDLTEGSATQVRELQKQALAAEGGDIEDGTEKGKRKRKVDSGAAAKKAKEFKF